MSVPVGGVFAPLIDSAFPDINHIGWGDGRKGNKWTYLKDATEEQIEELRRFLNALNDAWTLTKPQHLSPDFTGALQCCHSLALTLQDDRKTRTVIGDLEYQAKYHRSPRAIQALGDHLIEFVEAHPMLRCADYVIPVPGNPGKDFHLPDLLARIVALRFGIRLGDSRQLCKNSVTGEMKNMALEKKPDALRDVLSASAVEDRRVLLIDDLYQSGTTGLRDRITSIARRCLLDEKNEGMIIDRQAHLMWAKKGTTFGEWSAVNQYCRDLKLGDFKDWRLPTDSELEKMYNRLGAITSSQDRRIEPFTWAAPGPGYWTSEGYYRRFDADGMTDFYKTPQGKQLVRPVRFLSPQKDSTISIHYTGIENSAMDRRRGKECPVLFWAAVHGYPGLADAMIEVGADVNVKHQGDTALAWALYKDNTAIALSLIKKGADINAQCDDGDTPLSSAILAANVEIVKLLLEKGAKIDPLRHKQRRVGGGGWDLAVPQAVAFEGKAQILELLLQNGLDVNDQQDDDTYTLLHAAVWGKNVQIVQVLLKHGADVNRKMKTNGQTPWGYFPQTDPRILRMLEQAGGTRGG